MPVATTSSGRSLYDHASTAFVHNMPLEALSTVDKAVESGQASVTQQLAEQFIVLHITALCAIYSPNDPSQLDARLRHWRQSSGRPEAQLSTSLTEQLTLSPQRFFSALWAHALHFYQLNPTVASIASKAPEGDVGKIESSPETMMSALQLPAPVFEALVLGALKVDEDLTRGEKVIKETTKGKKKEVPPGLEASRAMCEWLLAAHSSLTSSEALRPTEQQHLYDQYGRVLRLYALDVLGLRLQEWEYASEMVRCAKLITNNESEIHERTSLLNELAQAQSQAEARLDRHQAAKERARRYLQEQLEKRKASASQAVDTAPAVQRDSGLPKSTKRMTENGTKNRSRSTPHSPLDSPASEKSAVSTVEEDGVRSTPPTAPLSGSRPSSTSSVDRSTSSTVGRSSRSSDVTSSVASIRSALQAWLRHMGGGPIGALLAVVAVLVMGRRVILAMRNSASRIAGSGGARPLTSNAILSRNRTSATVSQPQGIVGSIWQKVISTVRMGTQVTYL